MKSSSGHTILHNTVKESGIGIGPLDVDDPDVTPDIVSQNDERIYIRVSTGNFIGANEACINSESEGPIIS